MAFDSKPQMQYWGADLPDGDISNEPRALRAAPRQEFEISDVEKTFDMMLEKAARFHTASTLFVSTPHDADQYLRHQLLRHPALSPSKDGFRRLSPVVAPCLYGARNTSRDVGAAIYSAYTHEKAPNVPESKLWLQLRALLRDAHVRCIAIGQFQIAMQGDWTKSIKLFSRLGSLVSPSQSGPATGPAIALIISGDRTVTRLASLRGCCGLPNPKIMRLSRSGADELKSQVRR